MTFLQFKEFISFVKNLQTLKLYPKVTFLIIGEDSQTRAPDLTDDQTLSVLMKASEALAS